jgi:hypothetical protein
MTVALPRAAGRDQLRAERVSGQDVLAFLVPAALFLQVHLGGQLFFSEVILLGLAAPLLLNRASVSIPASGRSFVLLGLLWLYGQVATDVYRGTQLHDLARGWSNVLFTLLDFIVLALLLDGRPRRYVLFTAGVAVGSLLAFLSDPAGTDLGQPWKFGLATPIALGLVVVACMPRVRRVRFSGALILGVVALLNLVRDFRSLALIAFLAALYLLLADASRAWAAGDAVPVRALIRIGLATAAGAAAFAGLYTHAASSGWLGADAQAKYEAQSQKQYGVLGGGRPEFIVSLHAIRDAPILGHGSWPRDPKYVEELTSRGVPYFDTSGLIPTHSFITGAWVSAGILGAPIWIWVFLLAIRALPRQFELNDRLAPLTAFAAMSLGWAIPFSPYGGSQRITTTFYVLVLMFALDRARRWESPA